MAARSELEVLLERKEQLIRRSTDLRRDLNQTCAQLRAPAQLLERAYLLFLYVRPALPYVAPIAGYWIARKWRASFRRPPGKSAIFKRLAGRLARTILRRIL